MGPRDGEAWVEPSEVYEPVGAEVELMGIGGYDGVLAFFLAEMEAEEKG